MTDHEQSALMRLPPELRLRIYEYVLLPSPRFVLERVCPSSQWYSSKLVMAQNEDGSESCHLLGSTCVLKPTTTHFYTGEPFAKPFLTQKSGGTSVLATSKEVCNEATPVLYENTHAIWPMKYHRGRLVSTFPFWSGIASFKAAHIKSIHLPIQIHKFASMGGGKFSLDDCCDFILERLPKVTTLSMHIDINLATYRELDVSKFESLYILADRMQFKIDVHVTMDWDYSQDGWEEPIRAEDLDEPWPTSFDKKAEILRENLIQELSSIFEAHGKRLRMTET